MDVVVEHLTASGSTLTVVAADLSGGGMARVPAELNDVWAELAPSFGDRPHVAHVRDIPEASIDGRWPGGYCYHAQELTIALPSWNTNDGMLTAAVAHEAHHMARWNHNRTAITLGETLVSEGFACLFEERHSTGPPEWAVQPIPPEAVKVAMAANWAEEDWDYSGWFFHGPHGRWIGYSLGYRLAKAAFDEQAGFDVLRSMTIQPEAFLARLMENPDAFSGPLKRTT